MLDGLANNDKKVVYNMMVERQGHWQTLNDILEHAHVSNQAIACHVTAIMDEMQVL